MADLLRGPFDIKSFALTALFIFAVFYTMYFTRAILLPLVLAVLLSHLFAPIVRALARWKIPSLFGAGLVLFSALALGAMLMTRLAVPASAWMEKAPYSLQRMQEKLLPLRKPMQKVSEASAQIEKITAPENGEPKKTVVEVKHSRLSEILFTQTPDLAAQASSCSTSCSHMTRCF